MMMWIKKLQTKRAPRGMATAMAVIILSSMLVISLVAVDLLMKGLVASDLTGRSSMAYLAAESGAERVLWLSQNDPAFDEDVFAGCASGELQLSFGGTTCTGGSLYPHLIEAGNTNYYYTVTYTAEIEDSIPFHVFSVIGHYHKSRRSVEIRYVK